MKVSILLWRAEKRTNAMHYGALSCAYPHPHLHFSPGVNLQFVLAHDLGEHLRQFDATIAAVIQIRSSCRPVLRHALIFQEVPGRLRALTRRDSTARPVLSHVHNFLAVKVRIREAGSRARLMPPVDA